MSIWIGALERSEALAGSDRGIGLRVRRVARMMGRPVDYTTEIVEFEPASRLVMKTLEGPFPMTVTYSFADAPSGTKVSVRN